MAHRGHGCISLLFFDIDVDFDDTWGEQARTPRCRRSRCCRCSRPSSTRPRTGRRSSPPAQQPARLAAARSTADDDAGPASRRRAARSPSARCRSSSRWTRSASRSRDDAKRFELAVDDRRPGRSATRAREVRAGAVPGHRPTPRSCRAPAFEPRTPASSCGRGQRRPRPAPMTSASSATSRSSSTRNFKRLRAALPRLIAGAVHALPRGNAAARAASRRRTPTSRQPVRRQIERADAYACEPRRTPCAVDDNPARSRPTASESSPARRAPRVPAPADARRSVRSPMQLHVIPEPVEVRGMSDDLGHLLVPAVAAPGPRQPDRSGRLRPDGHGPRQRPGHARRSPAQRRRRRTRELTHDVARDVALYGPGDIVGIDRRAIVRMEPRDWITNFEPNYLPYIEFYDEDFPWRYTPAAPDGAARLRPWLTLVVLKEDEFKERRDARQAAAVRSRSRRSPTASSRRPTSCGPGRTCTSTGT